MAGLNRVMLIGRLGRDPEIRYTQQGSAVVNCTLATSESWNDKNTGERQERTEWHRIVLFNKQAEIFEKFLSKGRQVYVEGRLQTSSYEKEGQTHYSTDIVVSSFQFLDSRSDNQGGGGAYRGQGNYQRGGGYQQGGGYPGGGQQGGGGPQGGGASAPNSNHFPSQTRPGAAANPNPGADVSAPIPDDDIPF